MMRARAFVASFVLALAASNGCDPSDPCDPGYEEVHGACYKVQAPVDTSADASTDASGSDEDGGADEPDGEAPASPEELYEFFGDDCSDESGCPETLICGAPQLPMCTQVNCLDDETLCPPDWTCTDISAFSPDPEVTSICLQ